MEKIIVTYKGIELNILKEVAEAYKLKPSQELTDDQFYPILGSQLTEGITQYFTRKERIRKMNEE